MMSNWKKYERLVSAFCTDKYSNEDTTVTANAKILGTISGEQRQVDVLIDKRFSLDIKRRIIIDAKNYSRKVDISEVERFESMMKDCRAEYGFLVCPEGFTRGAQRRAQKKITLKLLTLSDLEQFSFDSYDFCTSQNCLNRADKGVIYWGDAFGISLPDETISTFSVAKCDVCHQFHIWCFSCGEKFVLGDEDEHHCSCNQSYFWLTAIE